ncbi:rRNA (cytosine-C5-)-methyltransferase nop2 [Phlyctochytrium bullatum]|nr:rRNA (cytosine-C5-)-methyltransferase nop2 [Phlyctochytrium bullatum]
MGSRGHQAAKKQRPPKPLDDATFNKLKAKHQKRKDASSDAESMEVSDGEVAAPIFKTSNQFQQLRQKPKAAKNQKAEVSSSAPKSGKPVDGNRKKGSQAANDAKKAEASKGGQSSSLQQKSAKALNVPKSTGQTGKVGKPGEAVAAKKNGRGKPDDAKSLQTPKQQTSQKSARNGNARKRPLDDEEDESTVSKSLGNSRKKRNIVQVKGPIASNDDDEEDDDLSENLETDDGDEDDIPVEIDTDENDDDESQEEDDDDLNSEEVFDSSFHLEDDEEDDVVPSKAKGGSKSKVMSLADLDEADLDDDDDSQEDLMGDDFDGEEDDEDLGVKKISMDFGMDDDDDGDADDDDEMIEFEKEALEEDEEEAEINRLADEEMKTNIAQRETFVLPSGQEIERDASRPEDLQLVHTRIQEIVRVLNNFKDLKEPDRSRSEYVAQLLKDLCVYYGYNEYLMEKLFHLFPVSESIEFFEANEVQRPVVIRANTLKTRRRDLAQTLMNKGVQLEPVGKWSKVGLQIFDSPIPIGATPEYLAGHYMLQAASSFLPVMALSPQEGERVLDMCSAPGGKSTYLAALMKNTGCVFANDANKDRCKALVANVHRMGARNVVVCNCDGRAFPGVIGGFDRVLLDAPCSGTGVIAKDPSVKANKSQADFDMLAQVQRELILAAIDSVDATSKTGGFIVYSTCSVTVEENEDVVNYALKKRPNVKLVETGLDFGKEGFTKYRGKNFHPSLSMTRRYYPHTYNMDGFYVAKFKKISNKFQAAKGEDSRDDDSADVSESEKFLEVADGVQFDDEEDKEIIERGQQKRLKKKGVDPKAKAVKGQTPADARQKKAKQDVEMEAEDEGEPEEQEEEPAEDVVDDDPSDIFRDHGSKKELDRETKKKLRDEKKRAKKEALKNLKQPATGKPVAGKSGRQAKSK